MSLPQLERKLIERIRRLVQSDRTRALVRGIGDDCAVLKVAPRHELLVTTDLCIENIHFRRDWHPPDSVGYRCLARGLSDVAAMGGEPLACFLSLGLPAKTSQTWVDHFLQGLLRLARQFGVVLAGGDISAASIITADIIVTGQAPSGKAVLRSGARPGDRIYVTGDLGGSAAVLKKLFANNKVRAASSSRHFYPIPRLDVGRWLGQRGLATAMIDLSDGLSVDLAHLCQESRVSARISAGGVPVAEGASLKLALHGGEDYELLFTAPTKGKIPSRIAGIKITEIGLIQARKDSRFPVTLLNETGKAQPLPARGWQHFAKQR